jgi:hypothetical protein
MSDVNNTKARRRKGAHACDQTMLAALAAAA